MDIAESGGGLAMIMQAGGWKSSAFKFYLENRSLERGAVSAAQLKCVDHSSESEAEGV